MYSAVKKGILEDPRTGTLAMKPKRVSVLGDEFGTSLKTDHLQFPADDQVMRIYLLEGEYSRYNTSPYGYIFFTNANAMERKAADEKNRHASAIAQVTGSPMEWYGTILMLNKECAQTRQEDMVIDLVNNNHSEAQLKAAPPWSDQGEDSSEDEDDQDPMKMDENYEEPQEVTVRIHKERGVRAKNLQIPPNGR
ncbi:hypothetical protein M422DRAFT_275710 [Sphaerobolus stellatus SS14]|uniref:Uncharacterized protein n=1 Tax=Sphaerobolus stellatus (strain SS14) TaxID=990650 RepID=A0A0C9T455_SPHS4|nr:hypothetical protein M422DRAFT_275710 [Sphaerobolus stellatus SS14]